MLLLVRKYFEILFGMMKTLLTILLVAAAVVGRAADTWPVSALKAFGPHPSLFDQEVVATNGLECVLSILKNRLAYDYGHKTYLPPVCIVKVASHMADSFTCLELPASDLCVVALFDEHGRAVEKTDFGLMFGSKLDDAGIGQWRQQWIRDQQGDSRQDIFIDLYGSQSLNQNVSPFPSRVCSFSLLDVFKIAKPGNYELHVQLRLVQSAKDVSGKFHFPITALPEAVAKIKVNAEDLKEMASKKD